MSLYFIETAHGGALEPGRYLGFAYGIHAADACDEWACAETGAERIEDAWKALGITADDVTAKDAAEDLGEVDA